MNQNQEGEEEREDEEGLHADDTSELLSRRNLIVKQTIDGKEKKKEDMRETTRGRKKIMRRTTRGRKKMVTRKRKPIGTSWNCGKTCRSNLNK